MILPFCQDHFELWSVSQCADRDSYLSILSTVEVTIKNTGHSQTQRPLKNSLTISFILTWNACVLYCPESTNQSTVISSRPFFPNVRPRSTPIGYVTYLQVLPEKKKKNSKGN